MAGLGMRPDSLDLMLAPAHGMGKVGRNPRRNPKLGRAGKQKIPDAPKRFKR